VWEDEISIAFLDANPVKKGHVLLVPKEHYSDILEINDVLYSKLLINAKRLSIKIRDTVKSPRVGFAIEGFGVDHLHIHLVPVYEGGDLNPEKAYKASEEELKEMQKKISF